MTTKHSVHHLVEVDGASPISGSSVKALHEPTGTYTYTTSFSGQQKKGPDDLSHVDPPELNDCSN